MPGGVPVSPPEPVIKPRNFNELRGFCFSGPSNADLQEVAGRFAHASRERPCCTGVTDICRDGSPSLFWCNHAPDDTEIRQGPKRTFLQ